MNTSFRCCAQLSLLLVLLWLTGCSQQDDSKPAQPSADPADPATAMSDAATPSTDMGDSSSAMDTPTTESSSTDAESSDTATTETQTSAQASESMSDASTAEPPADTNEQSTTEHEAQLALARKSGCLACHAVDLKVVGPAWRDVSKRYKDDPDAKAKLITKVAKGGRGNWTEVVGAAAMPPYSPRVSDENIALLVDFVLALEKP